MTTEGGALVSTESLEACLHDPGLRVLDASWYMEGVSRDADAEFLEGHIPGSLRFDLARASAPHAALPHTLPSAAQFAAYVGSLGISADDNIVIYDAAGMSPSARAWWMFKVHGHERVRVLDGGLDKWKREGRPLERGEASAKPVFYPARREPRRLADISTVEAASRDGLQIVDARPAARFSGAAAEPRPGLRSGSIPGSVNLPWTTLVDPATGTFRRTEEIEALFRQAGVDPRQPAICTCGSGVTACALALGLEQLGNRQTSVYDGSWSEWATRHPG